MNAIVVVDQKWAIGREGGLLFSLPTDMKRFRALTLNGTVILGRKTLDTFPGGRPPAQTAQHRHLPPDGSGDRGCRAGGQPGGGPGGGR